MQIAVDIDTREIKSDIAGAATVTAAWHDQFYVWVRFTRGGGTADLGSGAAGTRVGVKKAGDQSGGFLAATSGFRKQGDGENARYRFWLNCDTEEMGAAFAAAGTGDVAGMLEVEFYMNGERRTSKPLTLPVIRDYIQGDESDPVPAVEGTDAALPLRIGNNVRFVEVDTGAERGFTIQVRGAGDVWADQVSFTEGY